MQEKILPTIDTPAKIAQLSPAQLERLASELREEILAVVSQTGGHLASNLGVVELTVALLRCFDVPDDKIVWDVGHQ
jgi:1-deoxy-D-xylulose-5-phosphate synthase